MSGEELSRLLEKVSRRLAALVLKDADEGQPGGVVDSHVDEVGASAKLFGLFRQPAARPNTRWPPPGGIRPSFFTSR
jgi:hypothetical protein